MRRKREFFDEKPKRKGEKRKKSFFIQLGIILIKGEYCLELLL